MFRQFGLTSVEMVHAFLQCASWHVHIVSQRSQKVLSGFRLRVNPIPQRPRRVHAHLANGIVQQFRQRAVNPGVIPACERIQRTSRRAAKQRVRVGEVAKKQGRDLGIIRPRV